MKINYPTIYEIAYHTYAVNEFGMASFYVIRGSERGLVIDTASGSVDVKKIADQLCPVPYDVVLTHSHGDHCGGMGVFDRVWIHESELPIDPEFVKAIRWHNPAIWEGSHSRKFPVLMPDGREFDSEGLDHGAKDIYDIREEMFMDVKMPEFDYLEDGQVFPLGDGQDILALFTPGHTVGGFSFIDPKTRILFSGDSCNYNLGATAVPVKTLQESLLKLKAHEYMYDRNFNGHIAPAADTCGMSQPESVLDDHLYLCEKLLSHEKPFALEERRGKQMGVAYHGAVRLNFDPESI